MASTSSTLQVNYSKSPNSRHRNLYIAFKATAMLPAVSPWSCTMLTPGCCSAGNSQDIWWFVILNYWSQLWFVQLKHDDLQAWPCLWQNPSGSEHMLWLICCFALIMIITICCGTSFAKCEKQNMKVHDELGYVAIPPCLWGDPEVRSVLICPSLFPALNFDRKAFRNRSSSTSTPTWLPSRGTTTPTPTMGRWPCGRWGGSWLTQRWTDE